MAKKWIPPNQDNPPVIGLSYLEKNYGKEAADISEILPEDASSDIFVTIFGNFGYFTTT